MPLMMVVIGLLLRDTQAMRVRTALTLASVFLLGPAGCSHPPPVKVSLPPSGASSSVVLDSYLRALVSGDCRTAKRVAASTFTNGNGELCGEVNVKAFAVNNVPATPNPDEVVYATVLTTEGSDDGTMPSGKTTWFYDLKRQDGQWRLVGGGSGP